MTHFILSFAGRFVINAISRVPEGHALLDAIGQHFQCLVRAGNRSRRDRLLRRLRLGFEIQFAIADGFQHRTRHVKFSSTAGNATASVR